MKILNLISGRLQMTDVLNRHFKTFSWKFRKHFQAYISGRRWWLQMKYEVKNDDFWTTTVFLKFGHKCQSKFCGIDIITRTPLTRPTSSFSFLAVDCQHHCQAGSITTAINGDTNDTYIHKSIGWKNWTLAVWALNIYDTITERSYKHASTLLRECVPWSTWRSSKSQCTTCLFVNYLNEARRKHHYEVILPAWNREYVQTDQQNIFEQISEEMNEKNKVCGVILPQIIRRNVMKYLLV